MVAGRRGGGQAAGRRRQGGAPARARYVRREGGGSAAGRRRRECVGAAAPEEARSIVFGGDLILRAATMSGRHFCPFGEGKARLGRVVDPVVPIQVGGFLSLKK